MYGHRSRIRRTWYSVALDVVVLIAVVDLSLLFSSLPSPFDFDLDMVRFHPVFFLWVLCCLLGFGFCCDSFSIRMIHMLCIYIYLDTYADRTFSFLSEVLRSIPLVFSYCVYYYLMFYVTTDCIVATSSSVFICFAPEVLSSPPELLEPVP